MPIDIIFKLPAHTEDSKNFFNLQKSFTTYIFILFNIIMRYEKEPSNKSLEDIISIKNYE